MITLIGCKSTATDTPDVRGKVALISEALDFAAAAEFYRARQLTQQVLDEDPSDADAQQLMAEIIDSEIALQKDAFEKKTVDEFTSDEKEDAAKTWLERSEGLLGAKQYEQAILAAERVFLYEPNNVKASQLIDQIKKEAREAGQEESLILQQHYDEEIQIRVQRYRKQVRIWIEEEKWGAAKLAAEKILLLAPRDHEALKLYEEIKQQKGHRSP